MASHNYITSRRVVPLLLGLGALILAGCEGTEGYSSEYGTGQPAYVGNYPGQYPNAQPGYTDQYGNPIYPNGQPAYTGAYAGAYTGAYAGAPGYDAMSDYIYYPDTGVYYSPAQQMFMYRDGDHWERRHHAPAGWRSNEAGVHVRIQGGPEQHDAQIRREYPRTWRHDGGDRDGD